jgi:hypothetical protein
MRGVNETPERLLALGERSALQDAIDDVSSKKLRGDRRVRPNSESAMILLRGDRSEQFAFAWRQWTTTHHRLREHQQMTRRVGAVGEQVSELRLPVDLRCGVLDVWDEHRRAPSARVVKSVALTC